MKCKIRRMIGLVLAVILCFCMLSTTVFATTEIDGDMVIDNDFLRLTEDTVITKNSVLTFLSGILQIEQYSLKNYGTINGSNAIMYSFVGGTFYNYGVCEITNFEGVTVYDLTLSSIALSSGTLSPTFEAGTREYEVSVDNSVASIDITPMLNTGTGVASMTVNGTTASSGATSTVSLSVGENTIPIVITADDENGTKNIYTLTVTRMQSLPDLVITESNGGTLTEGEDYTYESDILTVLKGGEYTVEMNKGVTSTSDAIKVEASDEVTITLSDVDISTDGRAAIDVSEHSANIILSGSNILYSSDNPAIHVNSGSLVLSGNDDDTLTATTDSGGAVIGSAYEETFSGYITITSGTVNASSTEYGAGIGSGEQSGDSSGSINITGGTVTAYSPAGAGIGSGSGTQSDFSGSINISDGTVTASSITGAGIGSGRYATFSGSINITGGTVEAISTNGKNAGIGVGYGSIISSTVVYKLICTTVSNEKVIGTLSIDELSTVVSSSTSTNTTISHSWNEGAVTTEATCTEDGVKTYTCTGCSQTKTEKIESTGHSLTHLEAQGATCTADGNSEYWYCSECGKYFSDSAATAEISQSDTVVSATGHSYNDPSFTWSEDGATCSVSFTCTGCGDVQTMSATVTSKLKTAATETENGVTTYTATVTFDGVEYTATKELADIPATGSTDSDDSDETESVDSETTTTEDVSVATISADTGDNSQVVIWLVVLLVSGVGAAGIAAYYRKRRRSR